MPPLVIINNTPLFMNNTVITYKVLDTVQLCHPNHIYFYYNYIFCIFNYKLLNYKFESSALSLMLFSGFFTRIILTQVTKKALVYSR